MDDFKVVKSAQDWKEIEKILSPLRSIRFFIDEYKVVMKMVRVKMRLLIVLFIDGEYDVAKWEKDFPEISEKFYQKKEYYHYKEKSRESGIKKFGLEGAKIRGYLDKDSHIQYHWTSFGSLRRHLQKTCKKIPACKADLGYPTILDIIAEYKNV